MPAGGVRGSTGAGGGGAGEEAEGAGAGEEAGEAEVEAEPAVGGGEDEFAGVPGGRGGEGGAGEGGGDRRLGRRGEPVLDPDGARRFGWRCRPTGVGGRSAPAAQPDAGPQRRGVRVPVGEDLERGGEAGTEIRAGRGGEGLGDDLDFRSGGGGGEEGGERPAERAGAGRRGERGQDAAVFETEAAEVGQEIRRGYRDGGDRERRAFRPGQDRREKIAPGLRRIPGQSQERPAFAAGGEAQADAGERGRNRARGLGQVSRREAAGPPARRAPLPAASGCPAPDSRGCRGRPRNRR